MHSSYIQLTAKKSHYGVDGTGRDTYINFDNGGNFRGHLQEGKGKFQVGSFPSQRNTRIRSNYVQGKPLHYIGDGSGRDCYIITNQGGISKSGNRFNYLNYLRAPIEKVERDSKHIQIINKNNNPLYRKRATVQSFYQKNLNRRLSTPRTFDDPYKKMRSTFACSMRSSSRAK